MKKILKITLFLILGSGAIYFLSINKNTMKPDPKPKLKEGPIIAFGDSLVVGQGSTMGHDLVSLLTKKTEKEIINLGRNGDTTSSALNRIDTLLIKQPSIVIILLGGNDFLRGVSNETTFNNLEMIITKIQQVDAKVLLIGVRSGLYSDPAAIQFKNLSKKLNVKYVQNILDGIIGHDVYMSDAIHPNDKGYALVAAKIYPVLKDLIDNN